MEKVKIGFVGVGHMGQMAHLKHYATLPDCEVAALAEIRPEQGRKVAAHYNVPHVYVDFEDMLANEKLDGIVAIHGFNRHGILLPDILKAGIPILTEKPLAASVEVGERILQAQQANGSWYMVGYHKRSDPASMYVRQEIDRLKQTGELGKLKYVRILMPAGDWVWNGFFDLINSGEPFPPVKYDPPAPDMNAKTYEAYVSFVNYYIHQVNLMRYLLGEPYRAAYTDPSGVVLAVESQSGIPGVIEMSPYRTTVDWQESALIAFEKGCLRLELPAPLAMNRPGRVEALYDPGDGVTPVTRSPHLPMVGAMRQQAINFIRAIKGEAPAPCLADEALEDLKVARDFIRLKVGV